MFKENVGGATSSQANQEGEQPVLMDISKHTTLVDNIDTLINISINILGSGGNPDEGGKNRTRRGWEENQKLEKGGRKWWKRAKGKEMQDLG